MPKAREPDPSQNIEQYIGDTVQEARLAKARAKIPGEDWSQAFLGKRVFVSQSRISEVETGDVPPDVDLARKLESALGLRPDSLVNLIRILEQDIISDYAKPFLRRQAVAEMMHTSSFLVPGLLQTSDYARELMLTGQAADPRNVDALVEHRMTRQAVWEREDPPWMSCILAEAALHGSTGPQLERLLNAQEMPNISIRVLPSRAGHVLGTMTILTLPGGVRGAYHEGFDSGRYSEDADQVLFLQKVYDRLADHALTVDASTAAIHDALKRLH
ncbi:Scr1 family TA system antitoxin-like transcriptional regulator [Streptomyces sp. NPDC021093]|uniref:helix-turn-helix domain-containing protein n=1 Tax=Streptomyces sp. NPDC021093 TaxID=3365112 RepID=UPI003794BDAD